MGPGNPLGSRSSSSSSPAAARAHALFAAALAMGFLVAAVAYMIAASRTGWRLPNRATGMPAMWAALLGAAGLLAEVVAAKQQHQQQQQRPQSTHYYPAAVRAFQGLLLMMLAIATVALACLGDAHGAVWAALAAAALVAVIMSRRRLAGSKAGQSTSTPVMPLKAVGEKDAAAVVPPAATASPVATTRPNDDQAPTCRRRCARCCCLWTPLVLASVVAVAFGIGAAVTARERVLYPAPGTHFLLQTGEMGTAGPGAAAEDTVRIHMHCLGERADPTRPLLVFEHGGGASSFGFYGVQQRLAAQGVRSCAYDRPGFGWSDPLPVGAESLATYERLLARLLDASGERPPYVLVGHSAGVELVQVYAHAHPEQVAGVSLLDGYPNYLLLLGMSAAQARQQEARVCGVLQTARAFEGAGLLRPIWLRKPQFDPPSEAARQSSTYTNGCNFDSQWRVFCRAQTPRATEFLAQAAEALPVALQGANPEVPGVKWPRLAPGIQVQIVSAGLTIGSGSPTPSPYWTQAKAYNDTLAPAAQSEWVVCEGCAHGFPYERPDFLAAQLLRLHQRVVVAAAAAVP